MKRTFLVSTAAKLVLVTGIAAVLGRDAFAVTPVFTPGKLAVLQLGDGGTNRCLPLGAITGITNYAASDIFGSRQTRLFIDQFDPDGVNQTNPSVQIAIPTNGPTAMLVNGNAGTEGNLTLSGDKSALAFAGYQGDILSLTTGGQTAPSNLSYDRSIGTVDAFGTYSNPYRGAGWYGVATGKTNPRGVATDGQGNFWGCGNGYGSLYFSTINGGPIQFQSIALTSCSKVINNSLYASVKSSEAVSFYPAGVYSFVDFFNNPVAYPSAISFLKLEIPANSGHNSVIGFDINPQGTIAYMADNTTSAKGGISKYVKSGLTWTMAYHYIIPGYTNLTTGTMADAGNTNFPTGCFSVAVDWFSTNYPIVYATTADSGVNNAYYGNRVIRIDDTNTLTSGINLFATTNILRTVVKPPGNGTSQLTNIVYKSVTFTPDLRPAITSNPANWSAVVGDNVSFNVGAASPYTLSYQWLRNGSVLSGEVSSILNQNAVTLGDNNSTFQCVVTNDYGAVTSSVATLLVFSSPSLPVFGAVQNITNFVGNSKSITASITSGTDPKGGYQWYFNGTNLLANGPTGNGSTLSGTATAVLTITQAATTDAGVYSLVATNIAGAVSNKVANFFTPYAPPVFIQTPVEMATFFGRNISDGVSAYGQLLTYKWYTSTNKAAATPTGLRPLSDTGDYSGTSTATLQITGASQVDATNYVIVVSTPGGSITSAPVALTLTTAPNHTFVSYNNAGQVYSQNFNSLPIPGLGSAEGANPLRLAISMTNIPGMLTNGNPAVLGTLSADVTYSTDNPMDFGYPILTNGAIGGLGLSNALGGWYGWAQSALVFAAGRGDQSQGAVVDNGGNYYADGASLAGITNRALGLIATTKTGPVAFGVALVNKSTGTLSNINLSYTGELWRNNPNQQVLKFGYIIDAAGTNSTFQPGQWDSTNGILYVSTLDVNFAANAGTTINDGTQSSNQVSLAISGLSVTNWTPGSTLWLFWQGATLGTAQDVAIDNLSFSVPAAPAVTTLAATSISASNATLNASVSVNTLATAYYFTYGTSVGYGSFGPTNNLGANSGTVAANYQLSGLLPGTTYHYQIVADNSLGNATGLDRSFTTAFQPQLGGALFDKTTGLQFSFDNSSNASFTVWGTTNLNSASWQNLGQPTESPAGHFQFTHAAATNKPQQFYRVTTP